MGGYDVMAMVRDDAPLVEDHVSSDEEECVTIPDFIDVQVESDDDYPIPPLEGTYVEETDPYENIVDMKYKMWYMRNDFKCLLVYCGRDIAIGRCASKIKLKKVRVMSTGPSKNEKTPSKNKGKGIDDNEKTPSKGKGKGITDESQPESSNTPTKWTKEKIKRLKDKPRSHYCSFRLWASWMSSKKSFQIKSLYTDHKCSINYNMRSLITYKWIASHYAKEIINNPFITVRYMQNDIREKFMVDVVLESNLGSTCHLDVEEHEGCVYFKRLWVVYPSGYQVMEVRKGDEAYGVNLINRTCDCRMWSLSGIPCVHSIAACMHCKQNADVSVSEWYRQSKWYDAYQFSVKLVPGYRMSKRNNNVPPLPPIIRKMLGRPRTKRIRHPIERDHHVSRAGRPITCQNRKVRGHNRGSCKNPTRPKPPSDIQPPKRRKLGGSSVPGKGDGTGPSNAKKGGNGDGTGPSKVTKSGKGDGTSPSKAKKGDGSGPSKNDGKGKKVGHKDKRSPDDVQLFRFSNVSAQTPNETPNAVEAPNAVQAQHGFEEPNGIKAPTVVQASSEVQAPTAVQAPSQTFVVQVPSQTSSRVLRPRSQRIASKKKLNYVNDRTGNTPDKPVKL
ncbi:zinc finger, PMZ-type containing protein [Tanacetum coccineum]|uniref:Zinc finger, PMZ-type containing protein n=1 Tax=Tanacetum coccineum TaxID=301880 RepID=A0ABQ5F8F4_9ASTR